MVKAELDCLSAPVVVLNGAFKWKRKVLYLEAIDLVPFICLHQQLDKPIENGDSLLLELVQKLYIVEVSHLLDEVRAFEIGLFLSFYFGLLVCLEICLGQAAAQ